MQRTSLRRIRRFCTDGESRGARARRSPRVFVPMPMNKDKCLTLWARGTAGTRFCPIEGNVGAAAAARESDARPGGTPRPCHIKNQRQSRSLGRSPPTSQGEQCHRRGGQGRRGRVARLCPSLGIPTKKAWPVSRQRRIKNGICKAEGVRGRSGPAL